MKRLFFLLACLLPFAVSAQNDQLAQHYFDKGDFEKALVSYEDLLKVQPANFMFFQRLIECYQQLQQYDKAENALSERQSKYKQPALLVEIGYNYQLKKDETKAKKYYEEALSKIEENPSNAYAIAPVFEKKVLLEYALRAYEKASTLDPKINFNIQIAVLYGQLGDTAKMIDKFLDEAFRNQQSYIMIQNQLMRFMTEDAEASFNDQLRKALLIRVQKTQDIFWNQFLSWFFVQSKEYGKAFAQEKAIYRRQPESFANIVNLAGLAAQEGDDEAAREMYAFILENTVDMQLRVDAHEFLIDLSIQRATEKDYPTIQAELDARIAEFGINPISLPLQELQARFVTFQLNNPEKGRAILKAALDLNLNNFQMADVKMELADILLFEGKFNQASLYYAQIQEDVKNSELGHEASFKAARTSYFQGDFDWAQKQFKELKSASTQLIANDAMEYFLLISDHTVSDSTRTDLKRFAHADYTLYKNQLREALVEFDDILKKHTITEIEDVSHLRIGRIDERLGNYQDALAHYQTIVDKYPESIYIDEALFYAAEIYYTQLKDIEKAKALYEKILFNHQDSIFFVEARKKFRQLRGDGNT